MRSDGEVKKELVEKFLFRVWQVEKEERAKRNPIPKAVVVNHLSLVNSEFRRRLRC